MKAMWVYCFVINWILDSDPNQPLSGKHGDLNIPEKPWGDFDCYQVTEKTNFLNLSTFLIVQSVLGLQLWWIFSSSYIKYLQDKLYWLKELILHVTELLKCNLLGAFLDIKSSNKFVLVLEITLSLIKTF